MVINISSTAVLKSCLTELTSIMSKGLQYSNLLAGFKTEVVVLSKPADGTLVFGCQLTEVKFEKGVTVYKAERTHPAK